MLAVALTMCLQIDLRMFSHSMWVSGHFVSRLRVLREGLGTISSREACGCCEFSERSRAPSVIQAPAGRHSALCGADARPQCLRWHSAPLHRGLHSSTSQLNLSRIRPRHSMKPPSVFHKSAHDKPKSGRV